MLKNTFWLCITALCLSGCSTEKKINMPPDPHSAALPEMARTTHLQWQAKVDFEQKTITATAHWTIFKAANATEISFDSRGLNILSVTLNDNESTDFRLESRPEPWMGDKLIVQLQPKTTEVHIIYRTSVDAAAVQWLDAQQTLDKKGPFLFTQSQAILARTWLPCQDSPGIRFTYNAEVEVPSGMLALMSAQNPTAIVADGRYTFKQDKAIPSYLMALAVGYLEFKAIDDRTGVYAESGLLEKSWNEFQELPAMISAAEALYGPYAWGRYDLLVLPPSFPFGGMENPVLTFATPTIIAGDRSLTSLVAHELAHSWSGNLVTNANWNDFWLNEGFTVYFERRIMEAIQGPAYAEMLAALGHQDLLETLEDMGATNSSTSLKLKLDSLDPDEGMNDIAYEKGNALLRVIEKEVGRARMDTFLRRYFERHAFQVMTTEQFIVYLQQELLSREQYTALKIDEWIFKPGLPNNVITPVPTRFHQVEAALASWMQDKKIDTQITAAWSSHEWLHFIRLFPEKLTIADLKLLDSQYNFSNSGNSEILAAWFIPAIHKQYEPAYAPIRAFLTEVGRRKFIVPIYKALLEQPETAEMAKDIYRTARGNYHSVAVNTLDELLK